MTLRQTFPEDLLEREEKTALDLRALYAASGYRSYKMSRFEPYDLYAQNRSFVTGRSILTFTDTDGRLMALKPDVTLSIIKNYRGGQQKIRYHENVYRDSGSSGEFQEIPQAGLECIGKIDAYTQLEVLTLALKSLACISPRSILDVASVSWVGALLDAFPVPEAVRAELLKCLREKNAQEISSLCREAGMEKQAAHVWEETARMYGPAAEMLKALKGLALNGEMLEAAQELEALCGMLPKEEGQEVNLDFSILQDLDYYTGLVFRGYVPGVHTGVLSGGRYDHLVHRLGKQAGAIGFAVYLDLAAGLPGAEREPVPETILTYEADEDPRDLLDRAEEMRSRGIRVRVLPREEKLPKEGDAP